MPDTYSSHIIANQAEVAGALAARESVNNGLDQPIKPLQRKAPESLEFPLAWLRNTESTSPAHLNARCAEKGCVFPAEPGLDGKCAYHDREQREPASFHSQQPSCLLLERAKFGIGDATFENFHARDRRRLAAQREASWEEA